MQYKGRLGGGCLLLIIAGLIERYTTHAIPWILYVWLLVGSFMIALIVHGAQQHKRLMPRMTIGQLHRREWDQYGKVTGVEFYFDVINDSDAEPLDNVRVELIRIDPDPIGFLPVPLHVKHDSEEVREFSINPRGQRQVDLITGPIKKSNSQRNVIIAHTVTRERRSMDLQKYRMTVRATARSTPPVMKYFEAWELNEELTCVQL